MGIIQTNIVPYAAITKSQEEVLSHIVYDPDTNGLIADVSFSVPLNTFWLSDQWGISSGGHSVFFRSTDQLSAYSPVMAGIKNQYIPVNQDKTGVIEPFYRKPEEVLQSGRFRGDPSTVPNAATPYEGTTLITSNISVYAVRAILAENLYLGDKLKYTLWAGPDKTGNEIFTQEINVTADRTDGFDFVGWWTQPAEILNGDIVHATITVTPADGGDVRLLMVRPSDTDPNAHWNETRHRVFIDAPVSYQGSKVSSLRNRVNVNEPLDLGGTLNSDTEYFIDGVIDFTGTGLSIEVPEGGLRLVGYDRNLSGLICHDDNYSLFTSPVGGSGSLIIEGSTIIVTGTDSEVYDIVAKDGIEIMEISGIAYSVCTSLGTISGYLQALETSTARLGGKPSLTLDGSWSGGYRTSASLVRGLDASMTEPLFKAGASFVMQSRFLSDINVDLPALVALTDFSPTNFPNSSTLQFSGAIVTRDGLDDSGDTNLTPNISHSDLSSAWSGNKGLGNTHEGGQLEVTTEVVTVIDTQSVYVDLSGVFTTSHMEHFDSPVNGQLRHLESSPSEYIVNTDISLTSFAGDIVGLRLMVYRDATSSFEEIRTVLRVINNLVGLRDLAYYSTRTTILLKHNDYLKWQVANTSSARDVTVEEGSLFCVEER